MLLKVQTEKLPGSIARLEIEVEREQVDRELDRAYKRLANRVLVPGFRRGKAPRVLIERTLGDAALLDEASKELIPDAIAEAIQQEHLEPIAEPESLNVLTTDPFTFEVTVPLVPVVTLGDYTSIHAERHPVSVSDEQVEEVLERLREREAEWVTPDPARPAQEGDQLTIDLEEFVEDEQIGEQSDLTVVLGAGTLIGELESQLMGVEEAKDYEFTAQLSEEHQVEEVAGKPASFKVTVKSVKEKHTPELNDEFAASVGEGVSTLEELRTKVRENLQSQSEQTERDRLLEDVIGQIVSDSQVDVPAVLVERELDQHVERLESYLQQSNLTLDQFLATTNQSRQELRNTQREGAQERLVRGLVLSEVAKAENISVEDSDIDRAAERIAFSIDESELPEARGVLQSDWWRNQVRSDLYDKKVLNRIVEIATGEPLDSEEELAEPVTEADVEIEEAVEEVESDRLVSEAAAEEELDPGSAPEELPGGTEPEEAAIAEPVAGETSGDAPA